MVLRRGHFVPKPKGGPAVDSPNCESKLGINHLMVSILLAVCISGVQIQFLILMPTWWISLVPRHSLHFAQLGHLSNAKESYSGLGWPVYGPFRDESSGLRPSPGPVSFCRPSEGTGCGLVFLGAGNRLGVSQLIKGHQPPCQVPLDVRKIIL